MKTFFTYTDPVVPPHHPRVLVETAVSQGAPREALLQGSGVTDAMLANPATRISYMQFGILTSRAIRLTNNPSLGIDAGKNTNLTNMGVLGLAIMSAATVGAALEAALRHYRSLSPAWDLELKLDGKRGFFAVREAIPLTPFTAFATEFLLGAFDTQGRHLLGGPLPITRMSLGYPKPDYADRYREFYDVPIVFDQPFTEIEVEPSLLERPVASANALTARVAEEYCAEQSAVSAPNGDGLVSQVRKLLNAARGRPPALNDLAKNLRTSSRSLRRFLQSMGTSYQALLDESRRARAEEWVLSTHLTIEQVSERLGFSDVRSFRRAFKRWTGRTPNAFREGAGRH